MNNKTADVISIDETKSLPGLFQERVKRTPAAIAYRYFGTIENTSEEKWLTYSWSEANKQSQSSIRSHMSEATLRIRQISNN